MYAISKKIRDKAMEAICDFHRTNTNPNRYIQADYLYRMLPRTVDANHVVAVLEAMGYVDYRPDRAGERRLRLTEAGRCYFERKIDRSAEKRKETIRYVITTAIAVLALVLAAISLAAQQGLIKLPGS